MAHANTLDVDSIIERLLSVRGQPNNRTVQLAEGEIRALCASARGTVDFEFHFLFPPKFELSEKKTHSHNKANSRECEFGKRYDDSRIEISTQHGRFKRRKV